MESKWWEKKVLVSFYVALVAAVPPVTVGISSYFSARAELLLLREKQIHEIQINYLDRALDPDRTLEYRLGVLDFLSSSLTNNELRKWAIEARGRVLQSIEALEDIELRLAKIEQLELRGQSQLDIINQLSDIDPYVNNEAIDLITELALAKNEAKKLLLQKQTIRSSDRYYVPSNDIALGETFDIMSPVYNHSGVEIKSSLQNGVEISVPVHTPVRAIADGEIVYSGSALRNFGRLLVVKHSNGYLSAYAYLRETLMEVGSFVKKGDIIALSGENSDDQNALYFEVRLNGSPVSKDILAQSLLVSD